MPHSNTDFFINPAIDSAEKEYPLRLNQQVQDYIALSNQFSANAEGHEASVDEARLGYLAACAHISLADEFPVERADFTIQVADSKIALRRYQPKSVQEYPAQIMFFHGGGFVLGNLDSHDSICAQLAARTGMTVTAVDYRLAPEHPFPAAFDDCFAAYQYISTGQALPIILCGDSAGGTLAAGVSLACREQAITMPIGQLLIYPYLGSDPTAGSYQRHRNAPLLNLADMTYFAESYYGKIFPINNPYAFPLRASTFAGLPATISFIAEIDPIADDGIIYTQRLKAAAVPAHYQILPGLPHGFLRAWQQIDDVRKCWDNIIVAAQSLSQGKISS